MQESLSVLLERTPLDLKERLVLLGERRHCPGHDLAMTTIRELQVADVARDRVEAEAKTEKQSRKTLLRGVTQSVLSWLIIALLGGTWAFGVVLYNRNTQLKELLDSKSKSLQIQASAVQRQSDSNTNRLNLEK